MKVTRQYMTRKSNCIIVTIFEIQGRLIDVVDHLISHRSDGSVVPRDRHVFVRVVAIAVAIGAVHREASAAAMASVYRVSAVPVLDVFIIVIIIVLFVITVVVIVLWNCKKSQRDKNRDNAMTCWKMNLGNKEKLFRIHTRHELTEPIHSRPFARTHKNHTEPTSALERFVAQPVLVLTRLHFLCAVSSSQPRRRLQARIVLGLFGPPHVCSSPPPPETEKNVNIGSPLVGLVYPRDKISNQILPTHMRLVRVHRFLDLVILLGVVGSLLKRSTTARDKHQL